MFLETIQFISYAFTHIHRDSWKIGGNKVRLISNILSAFRISSVMMFLTYNIYVIALYFLFAIIFLLCLIVLFQILFINSSTKIFRCSTTIIRMIFDLIYLQIFVNLHLKISHHIHNLFLYF